MMGNVFMSDSINEKIIENEIWNYYSKKRVFIEKEYFQSKNNPIWRFVHYVYLRMIPSDGES